MKKYLNRFLLPLLGLAALAACQEDEGTNPGSDGNPSLTLYTYEVSSPYNADNDIQVRVVGNNKVSEITYLVEKSAQLDSLSEDELIARVLSEGTKAELGVDSLNGTPVFDTVITELYGDYTLAFVGSNGSRNALATASFRGLDWADVATGTYHFANQYVQSGFGAQATQTTLQVCTTDANLLRFKDLYGKGYSLRITKIDQQGEDSDGVYTFFRVPQQNTGLTFSTYTIGVRDVGYWQGNDAYVTQGGYESGLYDDGSAFILVQYFVRELTSGNSMGFDYDFFAPE